jgi:hypothetical protein
VDAEIAVDDLCHTEVDRDRQERYRRIFREDAALSSGSAEPSKRVTHRDVATKIPRRDRADDVRFAGSHCDDAEMWTHRDLDTGKHPSVLSTALGSTHARLGPSWQLRVCAAEGARL